MRGDHGGDVFLTGSADKEFTKLRDLVDNDLTAPALLLVVKAVFEGAACVGEAGQPIAERSAPDVGPP